MNSIYPLRQDRCAPHTLLQSVQPSGFQIQIVKQLNPTRPDLLKKEKEKIKTEQEAMSYVITAINKNSISVYYTEV